jgi:uncharacterized membrane protein (UPF0182 family)
MRYAAVAAVLMVVALIAWVVVAGVSADVLWFSSLGFEQVYWKILWTKVILWLSGALAALLWFGLNFRAATKGRTLVLREDMVDIERVLGRGRPIWWLGGAAAVVLALAYGSAAAAKWREVLLFLNREAFGATDPILNKDAGFYVFTMPIVNSLKSAAVSMSLLAMAGVAVLSRLGAGPFRGRVGVPASTRRHLFSIAAVVMLAATAGFWFARYNLLTASSGLVFGPGYTDAHARVPALEIMAVVSAVCAVLMITAAMQKSLRPAIAAAGVFIVAVIVALGIYPRLIQGIVVGPNELEKETPYILNNISGTRHAYGLEEVDEVPFEASSSLSAEDIRRNDATIKNARLWDWRPLRSTYSQIQEIRLYYDFVDADVDRYEIDGDDRQVLLSVRELNYRQIPSRAATWVNTHLKYTHGYGLCMSPVNQVTSEGLPYLFIKDIPPVSTVDLEVKVPGVYYGEISSEYALVRTSTEEFDYPMGEQNKFTTYAGTGGVPLHGLWRRLIFAWRFKDMKLLLTSYLTHESRIMFRRRLNDRVRTIAGFLGYDRDPYPVLLDGRILWVWDTYTVTDMYPYSEPYRSGLNYIRNSVKAVVDAYNGDVSFYVVDPHDPLIRAYQSAFPSLFKSMDAMPSGLREHLRYPVDLFEIQGAIFASYHMQDPQVFYNKEDQWAVPLESYAGEQRRMESYYVIMKMPGEETPEFLIMLPFTPTNKDNMVSWLAGRCDGENYGKLMVFLFPKQKLVYGPRQIEARIDQNPSISELLTLWSQKGSRVIRGNLLVIPIEQSLLYLEPLYLMAEEGELPELKRVIVAVGGEIEMAGDLYGALGEVYGAPVGPKGAGVQVPVAASAPDTSLTPGAATSALAIFRRAQEHLRNGSWAEYGRDMEALRKELEKLAAAREK